MMYQANRFGPHRTTKPVLQYGMKKNYFLPYSMSGVFDPIETPSEEVTWYSKLAVTAIAVFFGQYILSRI